MYNYFKGEITELNNQSICLEVNNIGYNIIVANTNLFNIGETIKLYIYDQTKEDGTTLFGFSSSEEKDIFLKLISVKGLGPKGAMAILSKHSVDDIMTAIINGNNNFFAKVSGIGPKTSMQIILDLKPKQASKKQITIDNKHKELKQALLNLGYKENEINPILKTMPDDLNTLEDELRYFLKQINI